MKIAHHHELTDAGLSTLHSPKLSERYKFISTESVVEKLVENDYVVTAYQQRVPRKLSREFATHLVRLRHRRDIDSPAGLVPEIIVQNSHDGERALSMMSGLFRMVCANGLFVGAPDAVVKFNHSNKTTMDAVFDGSKWIVEQAENGKQTADRWARITLDESNERMFAHLINYNLFNQQDADRISPAELFRDRYDEPRNLWTLYNNAQQTLTEGGWLSNNGRRARAVKAIQGTVKMNRGLWNVAETMATALS